MKDLFQIQTESGQLWLDIKAHLDAKDAEFDKAVEAKDAELTAQADTHAIALAQAAADLAAANESAMLAQAFAVEAAKLAIQTNLDALVTAAEQAIAPLEETIAAGLAANVVNMENFPALVSPIRAVIEQARTYTTAARRAKIEAELAAAQAAAADAAAKLAAL